MGHLSGAQKQEEDGRRDRGEKTTEAGIMVEVETNSAVPNVPNASQFNSHIFPPQNIRKSCTNRLLRNT